MKWDVGEAVKQILNVFANAPSPGLLDSLISRVLDAYDVIDLASKIPIINELQF